MNDNGQLLTIRLHSVEQRKQVFAFGPEVHVGKVIDTRIRLSIVSVSVVVLLMTTGLIAWQSAVVAVDKLWPVLLVIAGLLLMRMSLHDDMFNLAIALVVVVVCLAVVFFFAIPGSLEHAVINTPLGVRVYDVNPWI